MTTPVEEIDDPVQRVLQKLEHVKATGPNQWEARCPAHDDQHASLSVSRGDDGRALVDCHAGCPLKAVLDVLGLKMHQLFKRDGKRAKSRLIKSYDYRAADGTLLFQVCRFDPKDFKQRRPDGHGDWEWKLNGVKRVLYRLPELLAADPETMVWIAEGEKDVDNLINLGCVATCNPGGAGKWSRLSDSSALAGRHVVIIPDQDKPHPQTGRRAGHDHAWDVARSLHNRAASIRILDLPGAGKDVSDWIAAGGTQAELLELAKLAPQYEFNSIPPVVGVEMLTQANPHRARPLVMIDTEEFRVVKETVLALGNDLDLFQRGEVLVRVMRDACIPDKVKRGSETLTIGVLPQANLRERMTQCVEFHKHTAAGEEILAHPPTWLVAAVDARGNWPGIRPLTSLSDSPVLRFDGSICQTPGYDPRTGVLYVPQGRFPDIGQTASRTDAQEAANRLLDVVCDFCFETPAHRSAWLAALLTPLARFAFDGPAPLFLIDANVRGAGKTLLAQVLGHIALGREIPVTSYSADTVEMRKLITSIALAGDRMILLDNLTGLFGNNILNSAITCTCWQDRVLGRTENVFMQLISTWYATGNNVDLETDMARRCLHIRLDVMAENPEQRTGFKYPSLLKHVDEHRGELLADALTILSAFIRAGSPKAAPIPMGSFEGWSDLVRQAVIWVGLPDPCETSIRLADSSDQTTLLLEQLHSAWKEYDPFGTGLIMAEVISKLYPAERQYTPNDPASAAMRAALESLTGASPARPPGVRQVGLRLRTFRRRVHRGRFLDIDNSKHNNRGAVWRLYESPK